MEITQEIRSKLTEIVTPGLVSGMGQPEPGALCIEAAICLALGEPHGDRPSCVAAPDRTFAISLNDAAWPSAQDRADALLPLGLAQLGTAGTDRSVWEARLLEGTIRRVLPMALRAAAWVHPDTSHQVALIAAADRCAADGTRESAQHAAYAAADAAYADAYAAADAAAYAAYAAYAAADAAAYAADDAAYAADDAAAYAADAAAYAADAYAAYAADASRLLVLRESVAVALDAYRAEGRA